MNMNYTYTKSECPICGRRVVVERGLVGSGHSAFIQSTCLECMMKKGLTDTYKEQSPDAAKDLEMWYAEPIKIEPYPEDMMPIAIGRYDSSTSTVRKEDK